MFFSLVTCFVYMAFLMKGNYVYTMLNVMSFKSFQGFTYNSDFKTASKFLVSSDEHYTQVYYRLEGFKAGNSQPDLAIVKQISNQMLIC